MSSTTKSLPKPKPSRMERKMELVTIFKERKDVLCCLQETPRKTEKMSGFTEAFIQGSDNFKTFALSYRDKSKMHVQAINEGNCIESTKRAEQYRRTPLSLSLPKNASIFKWFNRVQATEKARLIKLFEVGYLIALKERPFSDYSSLLKLEKKAE